MILYTLSYWYNFFDPLTTCGTYLNEDENEEDNEDEEDDDDVIFVAPKRFFDFAETFFNDRRNCIMGMM